MNYSVKYLFILLVCLQFVSSCKTNDAEQEISFFDNDTISIRLKLQHVLNTDYLLKMGLNEEQSLWLQDFYSINKYKPIWIDSKKLNDRGVNIKRTLEKSLWFGIPENRLVLGNKKDLLWIEEEIFLTAKTALMLNDLNNGFFLFEEKKYKPQIFVSTDHFSKVINNKGNQTFDDLFLLQGPIDSNYHFIIDQLHDYCSKYKIDKNEFDIKSIKYDSLQATSKTKIALVSKGYMENKEPDSLTFVDALKLFQKHNGLTQDAVIGTNTSNALNESTHSKVLRAAIALEHLRRKKEYPDKYVRINIPEYLLRFYVNDSLKSIHRIVVGKPGNETPELYSKINSIVVYPYWNVPYSISSKEILPAVKNNIGYLSRNNYRIYRDNKEINPYGVNWRAIGERSFPYRVIQDPGPKNSLGIMKFQFHNNYSVYVHDTPSKSLFSTAVRAYSHGCMRCQNPVELGKLILDYDSIGKKRNDLTADSIDTLLFRGKNYSIRLKDPVPIYVEYITVHANRKELTFHLDIYKREEEYIKIMSK